ncbi:hypothetical protein Zmor_008323 [Zophobas morio]|uniref:Uncharacterized protein n=1 Tax=Zophobas morio TaxID=2755281 RepID=A0AA38MPQ9_9CUCU|nr:hypothetical protein Zmor_008323 [Zophobas morio]
MLSKLIFLVLLVATIQASSETVTYKTLCFNEECPPFTAKCYKDLLSRTPGGARVSIGCLDESGRRLHKLERDEVVPVGSEVQSYVYEKPKIGRCSGPGRCVVEEDSAGLFKN